MILSPSSFSYEQLSSMKFKELQKLSAQFRVNKRWAKKQELIGNLLGLKEKGKLQTDVNQEESEWRDGSVVFSDVKENNKNEVDRRLTFNVNTKSDSEVSDRRLTFVLPQNDKHIKLGETVISRETYVFENRTDFGIEPLVEARATFELPPKKDVLPEIDPRATFDIPQKGGGLLKEVQPYLNKNKHDKYIQNLKKDSEGKMKATSGVKKDLGEVKLNISKQNVDKEGKLQVKTLTIPYARVTRRNRKEASKADDSPIKISKKSINIKKSTLSVRKNNLIKSPALPSVKKSVQKQTIIQSLVENQPGRITQSKVPVRQLFVGEKQKTEKVKDENKENVKKSLIRMSKSGDEEVSRKLNSVRGNFKMHCGTRIPLRTDLSARLSVNATATPGCKPPVKPSTVTKMPDFNKIHKRHFEQMDSLPDYLKKKEERVRKLFGIPQPGQQLQATPVFRFQSVAVPEKGNKGSGVKSVAGHPRQKQSDSKAPQKEAFKSKLPPSKLRAEIKEENRNRIHGVRTNKRFELQMKLRNM